MWIDGGLHATEVLGAQQLTETIYQLVSRTDEETMRFLRDVIILAVHANPDGMELVSDWYMRQSDPKRRSTNGIPRLYQKYIGHDNNRDFYMSAQPESTNMNRMLYHEWFPQIMYNHHQTGPTGTILFAPPFRDPANYAYHPLIITGLDVVGSAMHNRFVAENKPGATMRRGANYSTWWNGGLRTTVYFHNMIGLLTESIGNPTPIEVAFVPDRQIMSADLPFPIKPQVWHFRQSIEYSITANRAVLDVASRNKEHFLFNIYKMGKDSIENGTRDTWTIYPKRIQAVKDEIARSRPATPAGAGGGGGGGRGAAPVPMDQYEKLMHRPEWRDARAYVLPSDQPDFLTATKFVNALIKTGIQVHRATAPFSAGGKQYPAGSYVVKTAQAFRPHLLDMFEPQDHPNDFQYPGGPPIPPYDNAGWTLAYQMGVAVRSRARERRWAAREAADDAPQAGAGPGDGSGQRRRVRRQPWRERRVHRGQPAVEGRRRGVLRARPQLAEPGRHRRDLHRREAVDAWRAEDRGHRSRPQLHCGHAAAGRRDLQAESGPDRSVGSVRRLDAVRLGPLHARAVRVPVRGGVPGHARRRQPQGEVRRAALPRRRDSRG